MAIFGVAVKCNRIALFASLFYSNYIHLYQIFLLADIVESTLDNLVITYYYSITMAKNNKLLPLDVCMMRKFKNIIEDKKKKIEGSFLSYISYIFPIIVLPETLLN